ncbi:MAG: hypothetical protein EPN89_02535 [Methylovulum sp.]|nr:MAG: hypothetical protein EPN89_02535 [Methylovulum sp.]
MNLSEHVDIRRQLGESICRKLCDEIDKLGFNAGEIENYPIYEDAEFSLVKDPYTGDDNLTGNWYDKRKRRIGSLQFNSDDTFYAEYDVVKTHPAKPKWFVEAINAWGKADNIKAEAKLLPMPE